MTIHIGASGEDIAETVLLPGDPYRAKWAANNFLDRPQLINETRGMLGFTGTWNGHKVGPRIAVRVVDLARVGTGVMVHLARISSLHNGVEVWAG